jgi:hypothetical protein
MQFLYLDISVGETVEEEKSCHKKELRNIWDGA